MLQINIDSPEQYTQSKLPDLSNKEIVLFGHNSELQIRRVDDEFDFSNADETETLKNSIPFTQIFQETMRPIYLNSVSTIKLTIREWKRMQSTT